jgi:hypothetical protein
MKKIAFPLLLLSAIISCTDDPTLERPASAITVEFNETQIGFTESSEANNITISLSKPSETNGIITVEASSVNLNAFSTSPAIEDGILELPIAIGQTSISFEIKAVDNQLLDGDKSISFTVSTVSEGFSIGAAKSVIATVIDDEAPAQINFMLNVGSVRENSDVGSTTIITLSHAAPGAGSIEISLASTKAVYGVNYVTEPEALDGKISLSIETGMNHVEFKLIPINDNTFNGDRTITYTITDADGAITKGQALTHEVSITDDELAGMLKSYESNSGGLKIFEYNEKGNVSKLHWEHNTLSGTYIYHYNESEQLIKIVESAFVERIFTWENGRITKVEKFDDGVLKQQTLYGYDDAGNVGEALHYYRQPSGEMKPGLLFVYLYYLNGNIYKQLTYNPVEGSEEYPLISTRTYENYLDKENPYLTVEILPNVNAQPNLPGTLRTEENGFDILYQFAYEFDTNGRPIKRTTTTPTGNEVAEYQYY